MKTGKKSYAIAIASAVLLLSVPTMVAKPRQDATFVMKDVHHLIKTAKTAEDHLKLAAYYRSEAKRFEEAQAEHVQMAKDYAENPMTHRFTKWPDPARHCRELIALYGQQAKEATALAEYHEGMASELAKEGSPTQAPK